MIQETLPQRALEALTRLLARFRLAQELAPAFTNLVALLAFDPLAPTAVREPCRIIEDHLADSLVALQLAAVRSATQAVDLGSGAGLPGLPLALALPGTRFTLLDSNQRKASFISRAASECGLTNATVVADRSESWGSGIGNSDLVTVRAVADLDVVAEYAAPLLRIGGSLVAWRGKRDVQVEDRAEHAAELLGLKVLEPVQVQPFSGARHRHLHVMSKVRETPEGFPRRPGMAEKRPLGLLQ
jgi:16S rRNA (guanine527-N7)-methyltransferase